MTARRRPQRIAATVPPAEYRTFCDAARRFAALRPWTTMPEEPVEVLFSGESERHFAIALGASGEFVGMGVLRGLSSLTWLLLARAEADIDRDVREELDEIAFSMDPSSRLDPWDRAQRKAAQMRARRGEAVPSVMVKRPGFLCSVPTPDEVRRLTITADAFTAAYAAGEIRARDRTEGAMWTLTLHEHGGPAHVGSRSLPEARWLPAPPVAPPPSLRPGRHTKRRLLAATRSLAATVAGDDRVLRVILLIDAATGQIVGQEVVTGVDPADAARAFWGMLGKYAAGGLPAQVTIANLRLFETTSAGLRDLGVESVYNPEVPGLSNMLDELAAFFAAGH